jgi:site-specific DNA recombinase
MYDELIGRRKSKQRSRASNAPHSHPQTKRTYLFRGKVYCPCGPRMVGEVRHERAYHLCRPSNNNRGRPDNYLGHPKTLYLCEDALLDAAAAFLADRVFGLERRAILDAQLAGMDTGEADEREAQRTQLQKAMDGLVKKQEPVLGQAMDGDPDDAFTKALRGRHSDLEAQRADLAAKLAAVLGGEPRESARGSTEDPFRGGSAQRSGPRRGRACDNDDHLARRPGHQGGGRRREDWRPDEPARDARGACRWDSGTCPR